MRVDFILLGSMKSGTSTLVKILRMHPDISFSRPKEPQFFSDPQISWENEIDKYHSYFHKEGVVYGEGSTNYTKYPRFRLNIWDDIYDYNKNMKFLYLIRNPVDRTVSHYMHFFQRGFTTASLEEAILFKPELINTSRYYMQIIPFIRRFGIEKVKILLFDDLLKKPEDVARDVFTFLGLDYFHLPEEIHEFHVNKSVGAIKTHRKYDNPTGLKLFIKNNFPKLWTKIITKTSVIFDEKPYISKELKKMIINLVELDIIAMEKLIERDLSDWLKC